VPWESCQARRNCLGEKGTAAFALADLLSLRGHDRLARHLSRGRDPRRTCDAVKLRRVVARLLDGPQRASGADDGSATERLAVVARLLPGSRERAAEIIATGPPYGLALAGFRRHNIFLAEETVIFVFEGQGIEGLLRELVNDPARSAEFSVWAPLLEGTPVLAREEFFWEARQQE
jgi:hypothetical protein